MARVVMRILAFSFLLAASWDARACDAPSPLAAIAAATAAMTAGSRMTAMIFGITLMMTGLVGVWRNSVNKPSPVVAQQ